MLNYWSIVIATDHRIFASTSLLYMYCTYYSEHFLYSVGAVRGSNYANLIGNIVKSFLQNLWNLLQISWNPERFWLDPVRWIILPVPSSALRAVTPRRTNLIPRWRSAAPVPGYKIYLYRKYIFCHNCVTAIVLRRRCRTVKWVSHAVTGSQ